MTKTEFLNEISKRGDRYGGNGGILDLLMWCGKDNTVSVTEEEARLFWEDPGKSYAEAMQGRVPDGDNSDRP